MNCDETFNAGICYVTDAYKRVCRFNEELHADLEKYRSENTKLREQVDAAHMSRLLTENENESLRELVSGLEHCSQGFPCNRCPLYDQSGTNHRRCESLERELGVEVDA